MAREIYFLTDAGRKMRETLIGPSIGYDGAEVSLQANRSQRKPIVSLPDRLEAPDLFDYRYFRTSGTVIKESGSQTGESIRELTNPYFKGSSYG